jgi:GNAT superfamily N-acetyltransferase
MNDDATPRARRMDWDSEFWGFGVAHLDAMPESPEMQSNIDAWCEEQRISVLMALVNSSDAALRSLLKHVGFEEVDVRVTLRGALETLKGQRAEANESIFIRHAHEPDAAICGDIASTNHRDSRFYFDPGFPQNRCDDLYRLWIANDVAGRASAVFVAEQDDLLVGYLSLGVHHESSRGLISLLGVTPDHHRNGIASALLTKAYDYFDSLGLHYIEVVTQARNTVALRFYESKGFSIQREEIWLHRWLTSSEKISDT